MKKLHHHHQLFSVVEKQLNQMMNYFVPQKMVLLSFQKQGVLLLMNLQN